MKVGKHMERDTTVLQQQMAKYRNDIAPLVRYLPWLKEASNPSTIYRGEGMEQSGALSFPVYDSTLMSFIKIATDSPLMDRNYLYVYSRKGISTHAQERQIIAECTYKDWDTLCGILSKYVLGGRTKGILWSQGVTEHIFYLILEKMSAIVTEWDAERNV